MLPTWSPCECSSPGETPGLPGLYTTKPPSFRRANAEINVKRHASACRGSNLLYEDIHARKKISVDSSSSQLYPVLSHCQSSYVQHFFSRFFSARIQTWFWQFFFPSYEKLVGVMWGKPDFRRFPPCCSPNSKFFNGEFGANLGKICEFSPILLLSEQLLLYETAAPTQNWAWVTGGQYVWTARRRILVNETLYFPCSRLLFNLEDPPARPPTPL